MSEIVDTGVFELDAIEQLAWALQIGLVGWILWRRPATAPLPAVTLVACLGVLALGWVWRLAYGFTLAADDFGFWIGDDCLRWVRAWRWSQDPFFVLKNDPWIVGSYVLHGSAMNLLDVGPLAASKLVSAVYAVLPLVGVHALTQALFDRREVSLLAVLLVVPAWLHVLLGTGLMTELPVIGLLLSGAALLVRGLDAAPGRRRAVLHVGGALLLAAATAFHMVAWIYLAALQLGLLVARLRSGASRRLVEGSLTALGSGLFCAAWLLGQWRVAGDPLAQVRKASGAEHAKHKLGTPIDLGSLADGPPLADVVADVLANASIYPVSVGFSLRFLLPLVVFGALAPLLRHDRDARRARAALAVLATALLLLVATSLASGTNITPFRTVAPIAAALVPLAAAALFPAVRHTGRWPRPALTAGALLVLLSFAHAHSQVFEHRHVGTTMWGVEAPRPAGPGLFALGRWLRREVPRRPPVDAPPVRLPVLQAQNIGFSLFAHAIGDPAWIDSSHRSQILSGLTAGQLVVSGRPIQRPELSPLLRIGIHHVYEARVDTPKGRRQ